MTQPGYPIEYDYYPPEGLEATLRLKLLNGLYLPAR
jgi:tRNA U34 5-carboxymethylaminomethyl modifying enzyme MnmG/GidA